MKITLKIDNIDKTFKAPFISARKLRETLALSSKVDTEGFTLNVLDDVTKFIVGIYGNQFTEDELLDGYPSNEFLGKALVDMKCIIDGYDESLKN